MMIMDILRKYPRASSSLITGAVLSGLIVLVRNNFNKRNGEVPPEEGIVIERMTNKQIAKTGAVLGIAFYIIHVIIE